MKVRAKNIRTYGKFLFNCMQCNKKIVCDQQRFMEEPKEDQIISCSKCGHAHSVKDWKPRKGGLTIDFED